MDSINKSELLMMLLQNGWSWDKSDQPGYVTLSKKNFKWLLTVDFGIGDLLRMIEAYPYGND